MQTNSVGGGEPFELDSLGAQSEVEDLIGKAILIYSKPSAARPELRRQAEAHLAKAEKRLPELTATPKDKDFEWLDASNEDDREIIERLQKDYENAANEFRQSVKDFRQIIKDLPDSLALLSAELLDDIQI